MAVAAATGRLTGAGAGKTVSAWQKRASHRKHETPEPAASPLILPILNFLSPSRRGLRHRCGIPASIR
jgi:hypothetical protein